MGRNEITMRLLPAEARVPMHVMRTGQMGDEDWGLRYCWHLRPLAGT
jgi:replicative DNA helicase